ncbi:uncharacterized protein LOC112500581 [Cynara cardunculus var. scolymus]|uniref:uncharacterized protein LOC112500581 n=1 Tax=Cynara cardunculus var. scolymus TaxID=59895 RepID=UPI000D627F21|nr:uncharacterized protein LOC112500581 [Cynara cardunculus var. scolymus]
MEGSSRSQGSMKPHYQYTYQPLVQNQPLEGEPSSNKFTGSTLNNRSEPRNVHGNFSKWTDETARLLIIAVSYVMEAAVSELDDDSTRWKAISTAMIERGCNVSPQQCEEKFGEIKKKYKQMIDILGRAMSCNVVENPILLDSIEIPERQKEEVRRLMSSDQFLYREMCSLRSGNRLFLPHDWELRRSVFFSLTGNHGEQHTDQEGIPNECRVLKARWIRLEEKKLEMQQERLQFEKERFDWLRFNHNEELKLEKMRLENERLKLKNARLALELKHRETATHDENN